MTQTLQTLQALLLLQLPMPGRMIKTSIEHRFIFFWLTVLLGIAGVLIYQDMPVELLPSSNEKNYGVFFLNESGSPDLTLRMHEGLLEQALNETATKVKFSAEADLFSTRFFFTLVSPDADFSKRLETAISRVQRETKNSSQFRVVTLGPESIPSAEIVVQGRTNSSDAELFSDTQRIAKTIEDLPEVSRVEVVGIPTPAFRVETDLFFPENSKGLATDLRQFVESSTNYAQESSKNQTLTWRPNTLPHSLTAKEQQLYLGSELSLNSKKVTSLLVFKSQASNEIGLSTALKKLLEKKEIAELSPKIVSETARYIKEAEDNVASNLFAGTALTCLCILLFVRKFWATMLVSLSIPISLLLTIPLLHIAGISRNVMSLAGIALSVGIVVDATLGTIGTFNERLARGFLPKNCAYYSARENEKPLLVTSLSTLAVFLPILLLDGTVGALFRDLSLTVILSQVVGFFVSVYIMPGMASMLHERKETHLSILRDSESRSGESILEKSLYRGLKKILSTRYFGLVFNSALFIVIFLNLKATPPSEFLPIGDSKDFSVVVRFSQKVSAAERETIAARLDTYLAEQGFIDRLCRTNKSSVTIDAKNLKNVDLFKVNSELPELTYPHLSAAYRVNPLEPMSRFGQDVEIFVDLNEKKSLATFEKSLRSVPGIMGVQSSIREQAQMNSLSANESSLYAFGVPENEWQKVLRLVSDQIPLGYSNPDAERLLNPALRDSAESSNNGSAKLLYLDNTKADLIPLVQGMVMPRSLLLNDYSIQTKPAVAHSIKDRQVAKLSIDVEGRPIGEIEERITQAAQDAKQVFEWHPKSEESRSGFMKLMMCLASAVGIIALIIFLQNFSLRLTLVVLCTFLWGPIGSIPGLIVHNESLNASALVGFILLAGTIVNNGILLVDIIEKNRQAQMEPVEACINAIKERAVNVIVTSLTTILGMLPMVFETGAGSQMYRGLAIVVVYGTLVSTPISLIGVPSLVLLMGNFRELAERIKLKSRVFLHNHAQKFNGGKVATNNDA